MTRSRRQPGFTEGAARFRALAPGSERTLRVRKVHVVVDRDDDVSGPS
jgi:hypothetical protein